MTSDIILIPMEIPIPLPAPTRTSGRLTITVALVAEQPLVVVAELAALILNMKTASAT